MPQTGGVQPAGGLTRAELVKRLLPGGATRLGFLGGNENLEDVIARDAETLAELGVSYDELADALDKTLKRALEMFATPVTPAPGDLPPPEPEIPDFARPETIPHFDRANLPDPNTGFLVGQLQVFLLVIKGFEQCPWGCDMKYRADFMIVNRETGRSVTGTELLPHLIRVHHFFGGVCSAYRTDPEQLAKVLELSPDADDR